MKLVEVNTAKLLRKFIEFPVHLYRNDFNYIRPLDKDIFLIFEPKKNKMFKDGGLIAWILLNNDSQIIGRIAAFYNPKYSKAYDQRTGGIGFFDCINNQEAANILFEASQEWLKNKGLEAMDGPINFGERDKFWGCLVQNFSPAIYGANYNFSYYQDLFENYGFKDYYKQLTFYRLIEDKLPEKYFLKGKEILSDPNYTFKHLEKRNLEKYSEDFKIVYNKAWVNHEGVKEMTSEMAKKIFQSLKAVLDENIVWFGYYKEEPIAFFLALPELNTIFRYVNGKLDWIGKLKFFYYKNILKKCKTIYGIVFGVAPEHQKKSVEVALVISAANVIQDKTRVSYHDFIMNWVGDFNPKMVAVVEQVGGKQYKTHITFRYLFNRDQIFERAKVIT